ncbi:MAG: membrane dipeptidase, partial [Acetatifactor sp.]|nr:membrane dipeptidase [Acetatifactor sp.]
TQAMEQLWESLRKGGFTERQLDKIFYANVLRVLEN